MMTHEFKTKKWYLKRYQIVQLKLYHHWYNKKSRMGKYKIDRYKTSNYKISKYKHQAILKRVVNMAI